MLGLSSEGPPTKGPHLSKGLDAAQNWVHFYNTKATGNLGGHPVQRRDEGKMPDSRPHKYSAAQWAWKPSLLSLKIRCVPRTLSVHHGFIQPIAK